MSRSSIRKTVIDKEVWETPHQYAKGIEYVFVNGEMVLDQGRHTNAHPGKIIRGAGSHQPTTSQR